ncbi:hypothetical protein [Flavobacterium kingsejongi]|uniref:DUF4595 domain-containing protein n=1 Tax=Flavobacterium kingsejongi TaxID=1678728 RepID=A0A2S1LQM2_9FLAO|nr:hypothetical protein [Flavobacterium kingsejongi]AWG26057.1 hypothetical protein FK004_12900 [Flavobacterium kingsejongi]
MKKITLFLFAFAILYSCSSDSDSEATPVNPEPGTPVNLKLISTNIKSYYNNFDSEFNTTYTYTNNQLSGVLYNRVGSTTGGETAEYIYENSLLVKIISRSPNESNLDDHTAIQTFTYSDGKIASSLEVDNSGTFNNVYAYNSEGRVINHKKYGSNGSVLSELKYEYNADGNLSKRITITSSNTQSTEFNDYDTKKNPLLILFPKVYLNTSPYSKNNILSDGSITYEYEYNQYGYPAKVTEKMDNIVRMITILHYNM